MLTSKAKLNQMQVFQGIPMTDWFPGCVDPVHPGWYLCRMEKNSKQDTYFTQMDWWNGRAWTPEPNEEPYDNESQLEWEWRGLCAPVSAQG